MQRNLLEYHKSINSEFDVLRNRVRHLIGDAHWQSDGEQKEAVLRKVLRARMAGSLDIMRGFICYPDGTSSTQIDVLIIDRNKPTLFQEGDLVFVTPDAVKAIIEVKTKKSLSELKKTAEEEKDKGVLQKLSEQISKARQYQPDCLAGLFVFEEGTRDHNAILSAIQEHSQGEKNRIIDWLALGSEIFIRFWKAGTRLQNPYIDDDIVPEDSWYSYQLSDLGQAYFVSNVVWDTASDNVHEMQSLWFPIPGGKEGHRQARIGLLGSEVHEF